MGANRTSGLGMITALSLLEQGFRSLPSPVAFVRGKAAFFENFFSASRLPKAEYPTGLLQSCQTEIDIWVASDDSAQRWQRFDRPAWSGHSRHRAVFDGKRG